MIKLGRIGLPCYWCNHWTTKTIPGGKIVLYELKLPFGFKNRDIELIVYSLVCDNYYYLKKKKKMFL